ncbi:MAG: hypothetical protein QOH99_931 [Frankiaceae bacterium]|nr:hypothetical protein [Frankiaceae bacterium]
MSPSRNQPSGPPGAAVSGADSSMATGATTANVSTAAPERLVQSHTSTSCKRIGQRPHDRMKGKRSRDRAMGTGSNPPNYARSDTPRRHYEPGLPRLRGSPPSTGRLLARRPRQALWYRPNLISADARTAATELSDPLPGEGPIVVQVARSGPGESIVAIGSACRWTILHWPSSRLNVVVTRKTNGSAAARSITGDVQCSVSCRTTRSPLA